MKKYILLFISFILLTGCSVNNIERVDSYTFEEEMNKVLSYNINYYNKIGKGYKYYAPRGMTKIDETSYNDILVRNNIKYYLYVDVVSYYYHTTLDYKENINAYYSLKINNKGKLGYIEITEVSKDKLFVEMNYNYAKIEVYTNKKDIKEVVSNCTYILNSMNFNDSLLKKMYEEGNLGSKEEVYYLFDKSNNNDGNFLEYVKEYDKYDEDNVVSEETEIIQEEVTTTTKKEEADEVSTTTVEVEN